MRYAVLLPCSLLLSECWQRFWGDADVHFISPQLPAGADEVGALPPCPRPGTRGLSERSAAVSWRGFFALSRFSYRPGVSFGCFFCLVVCGASLCRNSSSCPVLVIDKEQNSPAPGYAETL